MATYYQNERSRTTETPYNGQRFISALAARWAVFLDALQVPFEYRAQFWPPSFWLPVQDCWMLTLGRQPTQHEQEYAANLAERNQHTVYLFSSPPIVPINTPRFERYPEASAFFPDATQDEPYTWCECHACGAVGIAFSGWTERLSCTCPKHGKGANFDSPRLLGAYLTAVRARFA